MTWNMIGPVFKARKYDFSLPVEPVGFLLVQEVTLNEASLPHDRLLRADTYS